MPRHEQGRLEKFLGAVTNLNFVLSMFSVDFLVKDECVAKMTVEQFIFSVHLGQIACLG